MTFGPSYTALGLYCYTNVNRLPVAVLCKAWICIVVTSHIGVIRDHSKINKMPTARSGLRQMFRPPKTNDKCVFLRCFSFTHPLYQWCTSQTKTLRSWTATAWPSRASIISLTILKAHKSCRDDAGGGYEKNDECEATRIVVATQWWTSINGIGTNLEGVHSRGNVLARTGVSREANSQHATLLILVEVRM